MKKESTSFLAAFKGILNCIITERHFRFDLVATAFVIYFAARFYKLSTAEWAILALTIALVLSAEAFNTAIEKLSDRVTTEHDEKIKFVKDVSAGAVLVAALAAIAVAFLLFFNLSTFVTILKYYYRHLFEAIIMILVLAVCVVLITINPEPKEKEKEDESK